MQPHTQTTQYDFWLQEIIDAGNTGFISPEDVQKCISGYDEARFLVDYDASNGVDVSYAFTWDFHSFGHDFWRSIDWQLEAYRKNFVNNQPF